MKIQLTALILTTFLLSHIGAQNPPECSENCVECYGVCRACYRSQFTEDHKQCQPDQSSDNCEIHDNGIINDCSLCITGYDVDYKTRKCVKGGLKNCIYSATNEKQRACLVCDHGYPSFDHTTCEPDSSIEEKEHCMWGIREGNKKLCFRCISGYTSVKGICEQLKIEGCLDAIHDDYCNACNFYEGYFAREEGKCSRK